MAGSASANLKTYVKEFNPDDFGDTQNESRNEQSHLASIILGRLH